MKTHWLLFAIALTGTTLAQGPLTPPPGADPSVGPVNALNGGLPQATMKTLHQVEPRTAIAGGASGVVIAQSGAYYLAGNITVDTGDGITINASNVTLDLNGFSITTSAAPAAGIGVRLGQGLRNVAIRNGNIGGDGVGGAFTGGVYYVFSGFPQPPSNLRVADLSVAASEYGISTSNSVATCHVERCMVIGGSVNGIRGGIVKDCVVEGGPILGRIVKDCSVTTPGTTGIVADVVENCYATSAGTAIQAKCLVNSYGTGGGNNDVISAGVAQNVWAEGGSGTGDGIEATVVGNSYGKREGALGGIETGHGVRAVVVQGTVGTCVRGDGIRSDGGVAAFCVGKSEFNGGIHLEDGVIIGSNASTLYSASISASGTVVGTCRGEGNVGIVSAEVISGSSGIGEGGIGLGSTVTTGSFGKTNLFSSQGIVGGLAQGSYGLRDGLPSIGTLLKFDSN